MIHLTVFNIRCGYHNDLGQDLSTLNYSYKASIVSKLIRILAAAQGVIILFARTRLISACGVLGKKSFETL